MLCGAIFFFKQKTAYEMRISDWSSDVCSSDLLGVNAPVDTYGLDANAVPQVPTGSNAREVVAWYNFSARPGAGSRSEERRVGKECVSTCRSRWSPYH